MENDQHEQTITPETPEVTGTGPGAPDDGDVAIAGGKLPGNHDDFEGEFDERPRPVPGADKHHHPAHAMSKGETKHLGT